MPVTRGFSRRRPDSAGRLPPGQYDTGAGWPVLTAEATPRMERDEWSIRVDGQVDRPTTWTWDEVQQLPTSSYRGDIHCVTTWTKFDTVLGAWSSNSSMTMSPWLVCRVAVLTELPFD